MRKFLFVIMACCLASGTAFAQLSIETLLSEDKPQEVVPFDINEHEQATFFIEINGELDDQGRVPVQIGLENNSYTYDFLLFDRAWSEKDLRKNLVFIEKNFGGRTSVKVQNIELLNKNGFNEIKTYDRYVFPEVLVEEGKTYECKIPIHLTKPKPGLFCNKRKMLYRIIDCTIRISVENKDVVYDELKTNCDSLREAVNSAIEKEEFCTNPLHRPSFDVQTEKYTEAIQELRNRVRSSLNELPKESKKYDRYNALAVSLYQMEDALQQYKSEQHDCGKNHVRKHSCNYCKLSLEQIYNRLSAIYIDLYNGTVQRSDVMKEVEALYKCSSDPTCEKHSKQWKNNDPFKAKIIEFYNKIKNY